MGTVYGWLYVPTGNLFDAEQGATEGEPRRMQDLRFIRTSYYTEGIARIQYLPRVLHETRGEGLLAPRAFSMEQWSRL